jgi:HIV Tat-specific factor 1
VPCRDKASGSLKGDALITFLREPSVALAVNLMDGVQLRPGKGPIMSVRGLHFPPVFLRFLVFVRNPKTVTPKGS